MNAQQLATHIVEGHFGRRQQRRAAHQRAELQRQADFTRPIWWVHAHINSRAPHKPGHLAQLVADRSPDNFRDWQQHLNESRTAYQEGRSMVHTLTPNEQDILLCGLAGFSHLRPFNKLMSAAELVAQIRLHYDADNCKTMQAVTVLEKLGNSLLPIRRHYSYYN